jgi:hypothetical protein
MPNTNIIPILQIVAFLTMASAIGKLVYDSKHENERICEDYRDFLNTQYKGVVVKSYIDSDNHFFPILIIKTDDGIETKHYLSFILNSSKIINSLHPGDSITKVNSKAYILIKRSGVQIDTLIFNYGCKE